MIHDTTLPVYREVGEGRELLWVDVCSMVEPDCESGEPMVDIQSIKCNGKEFDPTPRELAEINEAILDELRNMD